jgi:phosphoglycolate phosphatase
VSEFFVFDLDGTLIDSRRSIVAACNHALAAAGRSPLPETTIATFVGDGAQTLVARALGLPPEHTEVASALADFLAYYEAHPIEGTQWMPGALDALATIGPRGAAVVTNKQRGVTEVILKALGATGLFGSVVAGGDGPLKPDPEPIRRAMAELGAPANATWVVGDGVQDVRAGKAAGCRTIAVLGGFGHEGALRAAGADVVLPSLGGLLDAARAYGVRSGFTSIS